MAKKTYKALTKVTITGEAREKGDTFEAESKSAHIVTALHFKQIVESAEKAPAADKQPEKVEKTDSKSADKAPAEK